MRKIDYRLVRLWNLIQIKLINSLIATFFWSFLIHINLKKSDSVQIYIS